MTKLLEGLQKNTNGDVFRRKCRQGALTRVGERRSVSISTQPSHSLIKRTTRLDLRPDKFIY